MGGTEIDVRELYRKTKQQLTIEKNRVEEQRLIIEQQIVQIQQRRTEIDTLINYNASLLERIDSRENRLSKVIDSIQIQQLTLQAKSKQIQLQEEELKNQATKLETQERDIEKQTRELNILIAESQKQQEIISEQKSLLDVKETLLNTKNRLLVLSLAFAIALLALGASIYRAYNLKRRTNILLEERIKERTIELEQKNIPLGLSEAKYKRLIESLDREYFLYTHDTKGIFTYVGPSISNILGYRVEEF